jgi:hypothetical protein
MEHRELCKNFYLFTDAPANDLRALEATSERRVCIAGDLVYREGEVADALFLIEMGTVDIMPIGKEMVFTTMRSGQGFGVYQTHTPHGEHPEPPVSLAGRCLCSYQHRARPSHQTMESR